MPDRPFNLAIETSGPRSAIALGRGDTLLASTVLTQHRRHNVALVPGIARLCEANGASPARLGEVYVSVGPGSFTGLRVAVATVKMLALARGVRVIAVPTLEVLAQNAPEQVEDVAVCLNQKRDTVYAGLFRRHGNRFVPEGEAGVRTMAELLDEARRPIVVVGDPLPAMPGPLGEGVLLLAAEFALPRAEVVWQLGRSRAARGEFTDPAALAPLYAREPEAVTLWNQRHGEAIEPQMNADERG